MAIKAEQPATARQLWRLNSEGKLAILRPLENTPLNEVLGGGKDGPLTVEQADAAIRDSRPLNEGSIYGDVPEHLGGCTYDEGYCCCDLLREDELQYAAEDALEDGTSAAS